MSRRTSSDSMDTNEAVHLNGQGYAFEDERIEWKISDIHCIEKVVRSYVFEDELSSSIID